ncbi:MAG TPA: hypothetical protein VJJ20_02185 [Candidatus Paceibacterota bacterium]
MSRYIVTNFAYGTGPYLRTTELALAFNDELERRGHPRMKILVPLVYGERQRQVIREEFGEHPDIEFDETLGLLLKSIFYTGEKNYSESLRVWVEKADGVSRAAHEYLTGKDIALEINRSPRITYGVAPSYSTTFGYVAEILEAALAAGRDAVDIDPELLRQGIALADKVEGAQDLSLLAYPGTFSWADDYQPRYLGAQLVPPIINLPKAHTEPMEEGLYVTVTGISGLERLYGEAKKIGLKTYTNDIAAIEGATKALPHVVANPAIRLQFARSGWGSVWLSMFARVPIVMPPFDPSDDPEIYFNNRAVEMLGIGRVYQNQPLEELLVQGDSVRAAQKLLCQKIEKRWGTLGGNEFCAKLMVDKFLG